jgi:hypothetical protein
MGGDYTIGQKKKHLRDQRSLESLSSNRRRDGR